LLAQVPVRAGETLEFPLRQWIRLGVELRPQLPASLDVSQQPIIAVVTRQPVALPPFDYEAGPDPAAAGSIAVRSFQRWLARVPPAQRGVAQAFYLVRRP
jgi:hypothetical protein